MFLVVTENWNITCQKLLGEFQAVDEKIFAMEIAFN